MSDDLRAMFPNSPSMWGESSAPTDPDAQNGRFADNDAPVVRQDQAARDAQIAERKARYPNSPDMHKDTAPSITEEKLAELRELYPNSWKSMIRAQFGDRVIKVVK